MALTTSVLRCSAYYARTRPLEAPLLTLYGGCLFQGKTSRVSAGDVKVISRGCVSQHSTRIHCTKHPVHHVYPARSSCLLRIPKTCSIFTYPINCSPLFHFARTLVPVKINTFSTSSARRAAKDGDSPVKKGEDELESTKGSKENVLTIPNLLTMSRIGLTPLLGYLIVQQNYPVACGLFVFAGVTDLLDGWIARRYPSQSSAFGSFLDPLADKFLASIVFLSLSWVHLIPAPLTALVVCRDVGLVAAAFYVRYISMTPPIKLSSFFDVTLKTAELKPTFISKLNTAIQLSLVALTLAAPVAGYVDHVGLQALWYLTAVTTTVSGVGYMFKKDTYHILKKARSKEL